MFHASMPRVPLKTKMPETVSHGEAMLAYLLEVEQFFLTLCVLGVVS